MPRGASKHPKIDYPPGCKELTEDLSKDELVRRLKNLARTFQDMGQDNISEQYAGLALYLGSEFFLDHSSKDVKLLVACCIADIFRISAPDAPYTDTLQLKEIFMFLTEQLRGLEDIETANFKRYFYLLENLAWVKSFNICIELDDNQEIFCKLFKLLFGIVAEQHSSKVKTFMLDMMSPLITEADAVTQELLDVILDNIIEPRKSSKPHSYALSRDLIKRTSNSIEPYIQTCFNNALMLGKQSESEVSGSMYELIYELNQIAPTVLLSVLPQLEFKLKSNEEEDRRKVAKLLGKMFSDPDSDLASQNRPLWNCYLGRFNDINVDVRRACVQSSQDFIVNHAELLPELTDQLRSRCHDPEESVRMDVVQAIVGAAKKEFNNVTDELLKLVKERTLDKKYKIRKEALMGLGQVYKRCTQKEENGYVPTERVDWIRNKILHTYYQPNVDDRLLVERLLNIALVPYSLEPDERMKRLYVLYGNVDENAVKSLHEIFKTQNTLRNIVRSILELQCQGTQTNEKQILGRISHLCKLMPDPKASDYIKKFVKMLDEDKKIRENLALVVSLDCPCRKAEECVKEILKKMGNPIPQNHVYGNVKVLLERIAPVMIDQLAIHALMNLIEEAVRGVGEITEEVPGATEMGMKLLQSLSFVYPGAFQSEDVFRQLIAFLKHEDDTVSDVTLQIFTCTGTKLEEMFPNIYSSLITVVQKLARCGSLKQAKHAIMCIDSLCKNKDKLFLQIYEHLKKDFDLDSANFLTALVSTGHMAQRCPGEFAVALKPVISKFLVKDLIMQDRGIPRTSKDSWYADHLVSEETRAKIEGMKLMVRWLLGMKNNNNSAASSTLKMLNTFIVRKGDLMGHNKICKAEMARLRLQAGCCVLKLAQESCYNEMLSQEQFRTVAFLINDPVLQVRQNFTQKLYKGLQTLRLPLQFMGVLCLAANDQVRERRQQCKQYLISNLNRRKDYIRQQSKVEPEKKMLKVMPDYVLPFTIHLLAHTPDLKDHQDVPTLKNIRECLWFLMEPLITKNEDFNYSFYRKMIINMKQTKDATCLNDVTANNKLYAVCDLANGILLTKTANYIMKDLSHEPMLPTKLFTDPDLSYSNTKLYLPKELEIAIQKGKKPGPLSTTTMNAASPTVKEASQSSSSPEMAATAETSAVTTETTSRIKKPTAKGAAYAAAAKTKQKPTKTEPNPEESEQESGEEEEEDTVPKRKGRPKAVKQSSSKDKVAKATKKPLSKVMLKSPGTQRKLTDFVSRKPKSPSKENMASPKKTSPVKVKAASKETVNKTPIKRSRLSVSRSPSASPAAKKRAASSSPNPVKVKKMNLGSPIKVKAAVRKLNKTATKSVSKTSAKPVRKRPVTSAIAAAGKRRKAVKSSQQSSSSTNIPSPAKSKCSPSKAKSASPQKKGRAASKTTAKRKGSRKE